MPGSWQQREAQGRLGLERDASAGVVTLGGIAYGQTVLARAMQAAGFDWNADDAHSAVYDAEQTAKLFCRIANAWPSPLPG